MDASESAWFVPLIRAAEQHHQLLMHNCIVRIEASALLMCWNSGAGAVLPVLPTKANKTDPAEWSVWLEFDRDLVECVVITAIRCSVLRWAAWRLTNRRRRRWPTLNGNYHFHLQTQSAATVEGHEEIEEEWQRKKERKIENEHENERQQQQQQQQQLERFPFNYEGKWHWIHLGARQFPR